MRIIKGVVINMDGRQFILIHKAHFSLVFSQHWKHQFIRKSVNPVFLSWNVYYTTHSSKLGFILFLLVSFGHWVCFITSWSCSLCVHAVACQCYVNIHGLMLVCVHYQVHLPTDHLDQDFLAYTKIDCQAVHSSKTP